MYSGGPGEPSPATRRPMRHHLIATLFLLTVARVLFFFLASPVADAARTNRSFERSNQMARRLDDGRQRLYREIERAEAEGRPDDARRLRAELAEVVRESCDYVREWIRSGAAPGY